MSDKMTVELRSGKIFEAASATPSDSGHVLQLEGAPVERIGMPLVESISA